MRSIRLPVAAAALLPLALAGCVPPNPPYPPPPAPFAALGIPTPLPPRAVATPPSGYRPCQAGSLWFFNTC